jgi:hypothetical protein
MVYDLMDDYKIIVEQEQQTVMTHFELKAQLKERSNMSIIGINY